MRRGRKKGRRQGALVASFHQSDRLGVSPTPLTFGPGGAFGAISCMFAIHYFFETEASLRSVLRTASASLVPGGFFFGVMPDGGRVGSLLSVSQSFQNGFIRLKREWEGTPPEFGAAYLYALHDTVTDGVDDSDGSREFLVLEETFVRVAAEFGLTPVGRVEDDRLKGLLGGCGEEGLMKQFRPR